VIATTDAGFERDVLASPVPVLVEFTAPWCRPCKALEPFLEALEHEHAGRLRVVQLDIDTSLAVPARYGVLSLPTVIVFARGEPVETLHGAQAHRRYAEAAARVLDEASP
jgi:thioredoxin 1